MDGAAKRDLSEHDLDWPTQITDPCRMDAELHGTTAVTV